MTGTLEALGGIEVVEFGDFHAGAVCAYHLHLLGAAVILAEPPEGCELRRLAQRHPDSGLCAYAGRGRRPVSLAAFRDGLAGIPDIVLEPAFPTPELEQALAAHRQRDRGKTITVSFRELDGTQLTELTAQAELGMTAYLGRAGDPPLRAGVEMVGGSAGILATQAILAALRVRAVTGAGQHIRVPFSRVMAGVLNNVITATIAPDQPVFFSQAARDAPGYGLPTADGAAEIRFYGPAAERGYPEFCRRIGAGALAEDPRFTTYRKRQDNAPVFTALMAEYTISMKRDALIDLVRAYGGMAMPKHDVTEGREWVQTLANDMVDGPPGARMPTGPWQINGVRPAISRQESDTPGDD